MSRIKQRFAELQRSGEGAYIPYICAGDPDAAFTESLAETLLDSGADILELGIPFSDPVADGPVIQGAMHRSLEGGFRVEETFGIIGALRRKGYAQPIVIMTYTNPVLRMGLADFCAKASGCGANGVLLVDTPLEESRELESAASRNDLDIIRLVSPSTSDSRLGELLARGSGYAYAVSVAGVTGARANLPATAASLLRRVVPLSPLPVVLGFGISRPDHVREALAAGARGVVEGSALVSAYASLEDDRDHALLAVKQHATAMKAATRAQL